MAKLYLARHGQSLFEKTQGKDLFTCGITVQGQQEAVNIGEFLYSKNVTQIYCSTQLQSTQTAAIVNKMLAYPALITVNSFFNQRDLGYFKNWSIGDIEDHVGKFALGFWESDIHANPPDGESIMDVYNRVIKAMALVRASLTENKNVLVISEVLPLQCLITLIKGASPYKGLSSVRIPSGEVMDFDT